MSSKNFTSASLEGRVTDSTTIILTIIQFCYGFPTIILMIFFLLVLGYRKTYTNSFYRLVQLDLLTNILCYLNSWFAIRLEKFPLGIVFLKQLEYLIPGINTWSRYGASVFMHMQFCSAAALSIHRITAIVFHSSYESLWKRYYPVFGLVCFIYSIIPGMMLPGKSVYVDIDNDVLTIKYDINRSEASLNLIAVFSIAYFFFLVIINCIFSLMAIKTFKLNVAVNAVSKKLTKIAVTSSMIYLGILSWSVLTALNSKYHLITSPAFANSSLLAFASDMMTLSLSYILLMFDSNVRNDVYRRNKVQTTTVRASFVTG